MVFPATPIAHQDPIQYGKGAPSRAAPRSIATHLRSEPRGDRPLIDYDIYKQLVLL